MNDQSAAATALKKAVRPCPMRTTVMEVQALPQERRFSFKVGRPAVEGVVFGSLGEFVMIA